MIAVADVDDLICVEQIEDLLVPIKRLIPDFKVTAYTVPNKFGPIEPALRVRYPWITFGIHGWEHTHFECLTWSDEEAERHIKQALSMGYAPVFKAPSWEIHDEIPIACQKANVILHHHEGSVPRCPKGTMLYPGPYPRAKTYVPLHTHILMNPATDYIGNHPAFHPENLLAWEAFGTIFEYARKAS